MDRRTESLMSLTATTLLAIAFVIALCGLVQFCG